MVIDSLGEVPSSDNEVEHPIRGELCQHLQFLSVRHWGGASDNFA